MYIIVSPFKNSFDEKWLIYLVPNSLIKTIKIWQIVKIPLKNNVDIAVVLDIINKPLEIELSKIKSIINIHNEKEFLNSYQVNIIFWLSKYYFTFIHNSLNLFFPKNLKDKILNKKINFENNKKLTYNYLNDKLLTKAQSKAFNQIINSNEKILFYWITWSWKTQIYIELINIYLQKNKQSLLLIPEIILNKQISSSYNYIRGFPIN